MLNKAENFKKQISKLLNVDFKDISVTLYDNSSSALMTLEEFYSNFNTEIIQKGHCQLDFKIDFKDTPVCSATLNDMNGCAGIVILSDLYVNKSYRNMKLATCVCEFLEQFSKQYGYGIIISTDRTTNAATPKMANRLGWTTINKFINPKTKNEVMVWYKNLI